MLLLEGLSKTFGDVRALDDCTFGVARGRMLGFLGPNGAGKTTAMRAVFGLVRPDAGTVTWDSDPVTPEHRRRFGYMPEQRGLYPKMKTHDQLTYLGVLHGMTRENAGVSADRWLERFGLDDRRLDPVENLSHGNQQRVQLAAALVHDPELLVLDEPFSGLDPLAVETMSNVLSEQAHEGKAVVFSSHQLDLVEDLCEEVAIINEGRIVAVGDVAQLKDAAPTRRVEIDFDGEFDTLIDGLDGVADHRVNGTLHTFTVSSAADIRTFLARADGVGNLRRFVYATPSLSDLFREAVR
ncbi:MAG: ATP-binding cassette domain-containing protein [Actinobacteria bacterium]|nr:ATP-binding cassette domain-containing protein [Actinomycetota bacterium]MCI0679019.1 ATP-binding cassette domain-containing protein [Actinomycetota bacterium]